jgi:hypothetical protein
MKFTTFTNHDAEFQVGTQAREREDHASYMPRMITIVSRKIISLCHDVKALD